MSVILALILGLLVSGSAWAQEAAPQPKPPCYGYCTYVDTLKEHREALEVRPVGVLDDKKRLEAENAKLKAELEKAKPKPKLKEVDKGDKENN